MSCGAWDENRIQYADDAYSAAHLSAAHSLHHQTRWRSAKSWIICAKSSSLMLCAAGMLFSLYLSSIFVIANTGKPNNCRGALKNSHPSPFFLFPLPSLASSSLRSSERLGRFPCLMYVSTHHAFRTSLRLLPNASVERSDPHLRPRSCLLFLTCKPYNSGA